MNEKNKKYAALLGRRARNASVEVRKLSHAGRVGFLKTLARGILASQAAILAANKKDLDWGCKKGLSAAMLDRLKLDAPRLKAIVAGVNQIASLPDPVGVCLSSYTRPDNLKISRFSVPIGSIFFIFESRPNVVVDGAALCIKSGNSVVLRGGKEAAHSNKAFSVVIGQALVKMGITPHAVQLVNTPDYDVVDYLLEDMHNMDLVIPRGGERLIHRVVDKARMPVIKHYKGVCHIYVDKSADMKMAGSIIMNAKTQKPGVCNAMETLLLDKALGAVKVRKILDQLESGGVEVRGCTKTCKIKPGLKRAQAADWDEEYLDLILSVKIVEGVQGAAEHIHVHGSGHTESIIAGSSSAQQAFLADVDSSSVMVNASTRFSDGGEYGLGAEVGISTDKFHARGPMGIESLTTYQWQVIGKGHIRT